MLRQVVYVSSAFVYGGGKRAREIPWAEGPCHQLGIIDIPQSRVICLELRLSHWPLTRLKTCS